MVSGTRVPMATRSKVAHMDTKTGLINRWRKIQKSRLSVNTLLISQTQPKVKGEESRGPNKDAVNQMIHHYSDWLALKRAVA